MEYFGKVAKCKAGKVGVITSRGFVDKNGTRIMGSPVNEEGASVVFYGASLDGSKWQSKDPDILADNIDQYITEQFSWRGLEE